MFGRDVLRIVAGSFLTACAATPAFSTETCFTAFGGALHFQFAALPSAFSSRGIHAIPGVLFGELAPCAGLSFWGIVGTAAGDGSTTVLGLRNETADMKNCGAVDVTVTLSPATLSGQLQLFNERTHFGNSSPFERTACVAIPAAKPLRAGTDVTGNPR